MILKGYGNRIKNIFQLLGNHENDITKSIAYTLSKCEHFAINFLHELGINVLNLDLDILIITYQQTQEDGISDIEILYPSKFHIIIEAKKGVNLPSPSQLTKYANDLNKTLEPIKLICTLSDSQYIQASSLIPREISGVPIKHSMYSKIINLIDKSKVSAKSYTKRILDELKEYLKGVVSMQDNHSNTVYVVPLNENSVREHDKERTYHCPVGRRFLKSPENYLGFRFGGKLQYINHVEKYETYSENGIPMFKFYLGPDIIPSKTIKTGGKYRGTKCYCDIDLLLTCDTIVEARIKTDERHR